MVWPTARIEARYESAAAIATAVRGFLCEREE
jgi:hypothetical protein